MLLCRLQDIMEERKISQKQISQITKIRTQTIANLRNNKIKQIPVDVAEKLCEFLDCNIGDLFEYKKD
jgi:putative transcriptional regulator